jgi:hypothetical protein
VRRGIAIAAVVAAGMGISGAWAAGGGVNWVEYLPPVASASEAQPGPLPHCRRQTPRCIDVVIRRLRNLRNRFGCDHRGVFATTYLVLTQTYRQTLRRKPRMLDHRRYLYSEVTQFASFYFKTIRGDERGADVPEAWRIALDTAREGEVNGAQDMLLGINAHVQNDMPFVIASLGLRTPDGKSRKPDHDAVNSVLADAYQRVVDEVERRYDPMLEFTNPDGVPVDNAAGLELVRTWRERVWRNSERLANAASAEERRQIAAEIGSQAADWARSMAAIQQPGSRARRDAYCGAQLNPG